MKDYGPAVFNQAAMIAEGTWAGGFVFAGRSNGSAEIAPFHKTNRDVPGFLKYDLKALRVGIIDGSIPTFP